MSEIFGIVASVVLLVVVPTIFLLGVFGIPKRSCKIWSETLNLLMDAGADVVVKSYTTRIGPVEVYTNDWEDYGREVNKSIRAIPDSKTKKRLRDYITRKHSITIFTELQSL